MDTVASCFGSHRDHPPFEPTNAVCHWIPPVTPVLVFLVLLFVVLVVIHRARSRPQRDPSSSVEVFNRALAAMEPGSGPRLSRVDASAPPSDPAQEAASGGTPADRAIVRRSTPTVTVTVPAEALAEAAVEVPAEDDGATSGEVSARTRA